MSGPGGVLDTHHSPAEMRPDEPCRTAAGWAALTLLLTAISVAVFYPENFILRPTWTIASVDLTPLDLLFPFMLAGTVTYTLACKYFRTGWQEILVLAFFGYLVARNLATSELLPSIKYFVYGWGAYWLAQSLTCGKRSWTLRLAIAIGLLTLLTALYGLAEYAAQSNFLYRDAIAEIVLEPYFGIHRIGSSVGHPVAYGAFLAQTIPLCLMAWGITASRSIRILAIAAAITGAVTLFLTYSKGSWIVALALAGGAWLIFIKKNRRQAMIVASLTAVILLVFIAIFWQEINLETATRGGESVSGRLVAWRAAAAGIREHWLVGVGLRQGVAEIVKHIDYEWLLVASRRTPVDNSYLSMFLEEGVIGFGLMLAAVTLIVKDGLGAVLTGTRRRPEAVAALASIIALLLNAITFDAFLIWPNFLLFWTAAGILRGASLAGMREGTS